MCVWGGGGGGGGGRGGGGGIIVMCVGIQGWMCVGEHGRQCGAGETKMLLTVPHTKVLTVFTFDGESSAGRFPGDLVGEACV